MSAPTDRVNPYPVSRIPYPGVPGIRVVATTLAIVLLASVSLLALGDDDLFRSIVTDLRAGGHYYEVVGHHLRAGNYPTIPFFTWRPPLVYEFIRVVGDDVARWAFLPIAICALTLLVSGEPACEPVIAVLASLNALAIELSPRGLWFTEAWAGAVIALSAAAYQTQRRTVGAIAAGVALLMRELSAPYALLCAWHAWRRGDRAERRLWLAIGGLCALYYGIHIARAIMAQQPGDLKSPSWVTLGGITLVLKMTAVATVTGQGRWNMLASALWLGVSLVSTSAPAMRFEMRVAVLLYVLAFAVVGQPFNLYWGLIFAPVQALAIGFSPQAVRAIRDYMREATGHRRLRRSSV